MILQIKVITQSAKNEIVQWKDGILRIRIKGVPEKGKVNQTLISFLAKEFRLTQANITILSGSTSRLKKLQVEGFSLDKLEKYLSLLLN